MKTIAFSLLLIELSLPAAQAKAPTPWDSAPQGTDIYGSVTVTTKDGKSHKDKGVAFHPSSLTLAEHGQIIPREEVKEVVVRERRARCCETLMLPSAPIKLAIIAGGDTKGAVIFSIFLSPLEAAFIAATPPAVLVEGLGHIRPSKVLYRVVP